MITLPCILMLENTKHFENEDFEGTLGRHLAETLRDRGIRVKPSQRPGRIPIFLERT